MPAQKTTPPFGSPIPQQPHSAPAAHPPTVVVDLSSPPPLPGMTPYKSSSRTVAVPVPSSPPTVPPQGQGNAGGGAPHAPTPFQQAAHTAQINLPPPQAQQWNQTQQEEAPPTKKWGAIIAIIAIIALLLTIILVLKSKDSGSSSSQSMGTKVTNVGQGSGSSDAVAKPVDEPAPSQAQPAPEPTSVTEPAEEEEQAPTVAAPQCPECPSLNEEPAPPPVLTPEELTAFVEEQKEFNRRQRWVNRQQKKTNDAVDGRLGRLEGDVGNLKADFDKLKISVGSVNITEVPPPKADAAKPVTVKIRTVEHDGPPPATPRPAKVTRK